MLLNEFENVIAEYNNLINPNIVETYEISFFKIYVKFQMFISDLFKSNNWK